MRRLSPACEATSAYSWKPNNSSLAAARPRLNASTSASSPADARQRPELVLGRDRRGVLDLDRREAARFGQPFQRQRRHGSDAREVAVEGRVASADTSG